VIYLKTSVGVEIRQEDLLFSCLRSNFAGGVFTSFARIPGYRQRDPQVVRSEIDAFFKREKIGREHIVLGFPERMSSSATWTFPRKWRTTSSR